MSINYIKNNYKTILFFIIIFAFILIFFTEIHPIIVFDTDDWQFINYEREGIPTWKGWNPSRILAETLLPMFSTIGVYIFMPFTNDYVLSLSLIHGLVVSVFITIYVLCFYKLMKEKFKLSNFSLYCITIIFLMFHFLIFRNGLSNNNYMFYTNDACCYYFYVIPALLNCILVMYFSYDNTFKSDKKNSEFKVASLLLLCYLAIFSNIFQSVILAAYIGITILIDLIKYKDKKKMELFIKQNYIRISIIIIWIIAQIFEMSGARAACFAHKVSFLENFKMAIVNLGITTTKFNKTFIILLIVAMAVWGIEIIKNKIHKRNIVQVYVLTAISILAYLILSCSVTGAGYISRPDVLFGFVLFIFIGMCAAIAFIIKKYKRMIYILPLIIFIIFCQVDTPTVTFKDSNVLNISYKECIRINNIIIDQIKEIEKSGKQEGIVYIPKYKTDDNWPVALYGIYRIPLALYNHGIVSKYINVKTEFSNEFYGYDN